jgi:putative ABC transport system permease protein
VKHTLYLALRSLQWYRGRAMTIVLCLSLTLWLPITLRLVMNQFQRDISSRADSTPLIIGALGSRVDLTLHTLYFEATPPAMTSLEEVNYVNDTGFATAIPLHIRYRTQGRDGVDGVPIVGTSPEYFEFRSLGVKDGRGFSLLGECVVGANAAERLKLSPGDSILSAPKNAFNLAGDYPLELNVAGILKRSHSADDDVVFTDVRTTWVIDGIGHGHQSLSTDTDPALLLKSQDGSMTASAAVLPFTRITPDNIESFHFHGDSNMFPISAIIAIPNSDKNRILLQGRYVAVRKNALCLKPPEVVQELMSLVFRIEQLVRVSSVIAVGVTAVLIGLVLLLSLRLRAAEMQTLFKLGASRRVIGGLLMTEVMIMLSSGVGLAGAGAAVTQFLAVDWLRQLLF